MRTICLVEGGNFLLGIEVRHILAQTAFGDAAQAGKAKRAVHLGQLLSRQQGSLPEPHLPCLELKSDDGSFFLVVDRVVQDIEAADQSVPLPPACPRLAAQLCPQAVIQGNAVVLLLEPAQVLPLCERLGQAGLIAPPELPAEEEITTRSKPAAAEETAAAPECCQPAQQESVRWAAQKKAPEIDEETFKKVMGWTVARFKQSKAGEDLQLRPEQLPPDLAGMIRRKGLSKKVIQYLIDQIVLRCQETCRRQGSGERNGG